MTLESQTEGRLQSLLDLHRKGYRSAVIDQAVSKLVALESEQNRAELKRLEARLAQYEWQFGMPVDVVRYRKDMNPFLKRHIEQEAVYA